MTITGSANAERLSSGGEGRGGHDSATSALARLYRRQLRVVAIGLIAVGGGLAGAAYSDASATGDATIDAVYRGLLVVVMSIFASRARRWSWLVAAGVVAPLAGDSVATVAGVAALALAIAGSLLDHQDRVIGAAVGACAGVASLGLIDASSLGVSAVAAAGAAGVLVLSGSRHFRSRGKVRLRIAVGGATALLAVLSVAGAIALFDARGNLQQASTEARSGLNAFREGDDTRATEKLSSAAVRFEKAEKSTNSALGIGGQFVPILGQHITAVRELSSDSAALSATIAGTAGVLEADGVSSNGRVDLARVAELVPQAESIAASLEEAKDTIDLVSTPWLLAPLQTAIDELDDEITSSLPEIITARDALQVAPTFFGRDTPRLYLTIVGNPAEARELGGFAGSYGLLSADNGKFEFDQISTRNLLRAVRDSGATAPEGLPPSLASAGPELFPQNWTSSNDFAAVGSMSANMFEQALGFPIDGVLYVDPYVLAALLEFTGPVRIPQVPDQINKKNAVGFLLRDQYEFFVEDQGERKELMGDLAEKAFDGLNEGALPEPRLFANRLGPLVDQRRLLFWPTNPDLPRGFIDGIGLTGPLPSLHEPGTTVVDELIVSHSNLRSNKLDAYLTRNIDYRLNIDPSTGAATATVRVALVSSVPDKGLDQSVLGDGNEDADGLPPRANRLRLSLRSVMAAQSIRVDGLPRSASSLQSDGAWLHSTVVVVPKGQTIVVEFDLVGVGVTDADLTVRFLPSAAAIVDQLAAVARLGDHTASIETTPIAGPVDLVLERP